MIDADIIQWIEDHFCGISRHAYGVHMDGSSDWTWRVEPHHGGAPSLRDLAIWRLDCEKKEKAKD